MGGRSVPPIARGSVRCQLSTHQAELNDEQPTLSIVYAFGISRAASAAPDERARERCLSFMGTQTDLHAVLKISALLLTDNPLVMLLIPR